jgi:hypothetical protein
MYSREEDVLCCSKVLVAGVAEMCAEMYTRL